MASTEVRFYGTAETFVCINYYFLRRFVKIKYTLCVIPRLVQRFLIRGVLRPEG